LRPSVIRADRDEILSRVLEPHAAEAFRKLPRFDQIHLLAVHDRLGRGGNSSDDLLAAGLLHDIGKADSTGHVRLPDRVARVLLRRIAPGVLTKLADESGRPIFHGLRLCVHHPRLGAERARKLGCNERTVWLIAHHEDEEPGDDRELAMLQAADRG
jgi:hypothetical protein